MSRNLLQNIAGLYSPSLGPSGYTLLDRSPNGRNNHGTLTNMDSSDWVGSPGGWALDFDGSNDRIEGPDVFGALQRITVSAWVYWRTLSAISTTAIAAKWENELAFANGDAWVLNANSPQGLRWFIGQSTTGDGVTTGSAAIGTGRWIHCAATYNGAAAVVYVDGRQSASKSFTLTMNAASGVPFRIGRSDIVSAGILSHDGLLDDVAVYNRAATAAEIWQIYQLGRGGLGRLATQGSPRHAYKAAGVKTYLFINRNAIIGGGTI